MYICIYIYIWLYWKNNLTQNDYNYLGRMGLPRPHLSVDFTMILLWFCYPDLCQNSFRRARAFHGRPQKWGTNFTKMTPRPPNGRHGPSTGLPRAFHGLSWRRRSKIDFEEIWSGWPEQPWKALHQGTGLPRACGVPYFFDTASNGINNITNSEKMFPK